MFYHPEMLVCFAAGNAGVDTTPADGVVDAGSIGSPASAKNCLTVGASENLRPEQAVVYGTGSWATRYPSAPISSDPLANSSNGMAAFSSRGPCADGRIKPDLVAPGTYIISTRTHAIASGTDVLWGNLPGNTNYCYSAGTSMATPLASGSAAVLREYLRQAKGITNAPAPLVKALLLNTARDLSPGQYGTGAAREMTNAPNNVEGWGLVNLETGLFRGQGHGVRLVNGWDTPFTGAGAVTSSVTVFNTNYPLRVHLAWNDYPASTFSMDTTYTTLMGGGLVDDLDLRVVGPAGTVHLPLARNPEVNLYYYTNTSASYSTTLNLYLAERCTAPEVPLALHHLEQIGYDSGGSGGRIATYVWAANGTGGRPGTVLFATTNTIASGGGWWVLSIPLSVSITNANFYIGARQLTSTINAVFDPGTSTRQYQRTGPTWNSTTYGDLFMHAYGTALTNDHANNVEGVVVDAPVTGTYAIVVSGANVPYTPVRYAVAVSGGLSPSSTGAVTLTVNSSAGMADPPAGSYACTNGDTLTCRVTNSPALLADAQGQVTCICTGWTGTGSVPAAGAGTDTGPFAITLDSTLTWQWLVTDLVLSNQVVEGSTNRQARDSIWAGNGYRVQPAADVTLRAGTGGVIRLAPGFAASTGGTFRATLGP